LNYKFADEWRVDDQSSLFDYLPGTSTATFTLKDWPAENATSCEIKGSPPVTPIAVDVARKLCRGVIDKNDNANCVKDVSVTGEKGFAKAFLETQRVDLGATTTDVLVAQERSKVTFTAVVKYQKTEDVIILDADQGKSPGAIQFTLNGEKLGSPVMLDEKGVARWAAELDVGEYKLSAVFIPAREVSLLPSTSFDKYFVIRKSTK
jgi:hypothetical protein